MTADKAHLPSPIGPNRPHPLKPVPLPPRALTSPEASSSTSTPAAHHGHGPRPLGPRSPESHRAHGPGSARTRYHTTPLPASTASTGPASPVQRSHTTNAELLPPSPISIKAELDKPHAPYRPPEPVIEPPEEHPPGYTPGIVAEHIGSDDDIVSPSTPPSYDQGDDHSTPGNRGPARNIDLWQADVKSTPMDIDSPDSDEMAKPQIGPGVLPRRLLMLVHEHELLQPVITELPQPSKRAQGATTAAPKPQSAWDGANKSLTTARPLSVASVASAASATSAAGNAPAPAPPSPSPSSASTRSVPDGEHVSTLEDVFDALPGGRRGHNEWYFCTTCWAWLRVTAGSGTPPGVPNMDEWEASLLSAGTSRNTEEFLRARSDRIAEWSRMNDLNTSRLMAEETHHHFHEFRTLATTRKQERIARVEVDEKMNAFPHVTFGLEADRQWESFDAPQTPTKLFVSCSSDLWLQVDEGMMPGQLPRGLVRAFSDEKVNNPSPGLDGVRSVSEAWNLLVTVNRFSLLVNPLFKGQRGWVKLDNPKFHKLIGASMVSSHLLHHIGFACQQEADGLRVGPFKVGDVPTEDDKQKQVQMDRYMIRVWVEMTLYLSCFQKRNALEHTPPHFVHGVRLEEAFKSVLDIDRYPRGTQAYYDNVKGALHDLGVHKQDQAETVEYAYGLQIACDTENTPKYLGALERVADCPVFGKELLQLRVATERSLNKYSLDDVNRAYDLIGYTSAQADLIGVAADEAPEHYILELHKKAVQGSSSPHERQELSQALALKGKERKSEVMKRLGESGQTLMSVEEAYAALSAPMDAVDDGLIMQYEMAVSEYPGKTDHYKQCLSIIANAPGQERPGIKTFLETGSREPDAPPRNDIPVGLQNIGNTCYLNSILQYLYSIKPLRDAVMSFEQDLLQSVPSKKPTPDIERSKRFVRQLRLLFLQLYKSELPSVRPDEELAYLAITRPEVDAIVEPQIAPVELPTATTTTITTGRLTLDTIPDIPDIPSPSSTQVPTPESSPSPGQVGLPDVPQASASASASTAREDRESSILGKRASEDRDDSSRSSRSSLDLSQGHARHKSDGDKFERSERTQSPMEVDDYEMIPKSDSPTASMDLGHLDLKSPAPETEDNAESFPPLLSTSNVNANEAEEEVIQYDPPSGPPPLPPRPPLAKKDTLSSGLRFGLQQDSAEVLINVLSQLELALDQPSEEDGGKASNLIQSLFSCKYRQQIIYESPSSSPSKSPVYSAQTPVESVFVHPIIGVEEEGKDLSDCLAELYLKGNDIEYEGKKGYMMDLMDEFPDLLYIQMRRSQYDPATGRERKTNTHIPFGQSLSMGRFLVSADPTKREKAIELTREMTRVRTRLHQLRNHKPLSIPATFKHVSSSLRQLANVELDIPDLASDLTPDLFDALDNESQTVEAEITELQNSLPALKSRMDKLWQGDEAEAEWEYELVSVFMHRGKNSGSGHYWTYQANLPDHHDTFFKYNDETVTPVPSSEVLQDRTGDDANPALLCYVRKGRKLVDTLHREILERQEEGAPAADAGQGQGSEEAQGKVEPLFEV